MPTPFNPCLLPDVTASLLGYTSGPLPWSVLAAVTIA